MKKTANVVNEDDINTPAGNTLHPGSGEAGSESWNGMLARMFSQMAALPPERLAGIDEVLKAMEPVEHAVAIPDNASEGNKSTIMAKPSDAEGKGGPIPAQPMPTFGVSEDEIKSLFGNDKLTEEFVAKTKKLFEDAVNARVILETTKINAKAEEDFSKKLNEEVSVLTDRVDSYLQYCVEEWMKDNDLEVTASIRTQIAEEFMENLKNLFKESYIEVPENKIDVVEELTKKVTNLEEQLTEKINENVESKKALDSATKLIKINETISELSVGLADTQRAKLKTLCEGIDFVDEEDFKTKATLLKEETFKKLGSNTLAEKLISEQLEIDTNTQNENGEEIVIDPRVAQYVEAITNNLKK